MYSNDAMMYSNQPYYGMLGLKKNFNQGGKDTLTSTLTINNNSQDGNSLSLSYENDLNRWLISVPEEKLKASLKLVSFCCKRLLLMNIKFHKSSFL